MLVLATLFIGVSKSLPKTAYVKMIDVWLLFSLFVPFVEVLLQTAAQSIREQRAKESKPKPRVVSPVMTGKEQVLADENDSTGLTCCVLGAKYGVPVLSLLFCVAYFSVGFFVSG